MQTTDTETPFDALQRVVAVARGTQAADTEALVAQCRAAGLDEGTIAKGVALWRSAGVAPTPGEDSLRQTRPFGGIESEEDTAFDDLQRVVAVARRVQPKSVQALRRACADSGLSEAATARGIDLWVSTLKEQGKR
jgi:hypothetical protein